MSRHDLDCEYRDEIGGLRDSSFIHSRSSRENRGDGVKGSRISIGPEKLWEYGSGPICSKVCCEGCIARETMRGHIKIFTLQINVERAHRLNVAGVAAMGGLDKSSMLSMDLKFHSPKELIPGK